MKVIPVILFAYARPRHLGQVLACLRENQIPLLYIFSDGAKGAGDEAAVHETRALVRSIDWCEVRLTERKTNLGLGRNVLAGVTEVAAQHEAFIVWEDDLICVPGTYAWMTAALRHYADDERVMSVTGWTHPRVTPDDLGDRPYFDGRAECWVWGAYARSWRGMNEQTARQKIAALKARGIKCDAYGADLPQMATDEERKNIWAVRWLYHHLQHGGLCLRPPWSMVEHIGFDAQASNATNSFGWDQSVLKPRPPIPEIWPEVKEHTRCRRLWVLAARKPAFLNRARAARLVKKMARAILPESWVEALARRYCRLCWVGDYPTWSAASAAAGNYAAPAILARVLQATRQVRDNPGLYERDGVVFAGQATNPPLQAALRAAAEADGQLSVLDFGGALGSVYWQHRAWLADMPGLRWSVVEQAGFVEAGRREFSSKILKFYETVDDCFKHEQPNVVLLSSVLPYLEHPYELLADLLKRDCDRIIIDRTGFTLDGRDRLTVQHVPPSIYRASYPCRFFDRKRLLAQFSQDWKIMAEWPTFDGTSADYEYRGLALARIRNG